MDEDVYVRDHISEAGLAARLSRALEDREFGILFYRLWE